MSGVDAIGSSLTATALRAELGWLLTYALHAAIAAVATEGLVRAARPAPADEHRLWRMALVLPLATACLATVWGGATGAALLRAWPAIVGPRVSDAAAAPIAPGPVWGTLGVAAAVAAALAILLGAARFAIRVARLRRRLDDRHAPSDPRLRAALARVSARFGLRRSIQLTESARIASPIAIGRRAICFPAGSTASLADGEVDAVLAHELAHLERRDPTWFFLAGLAQHVLWMQPFSHRVAARLRRSAEIACDERAVGATGDALGLARGLSLFAHAAAGVPAWIEPHPNPTPSWGGAAAASHALVDRVRRLAANPSPLPARPAAWRFLPAAAVLAFVFIGSLGLDVTFAAPSAARVSARASLPARPGTPDPVDVVAASRRAAALASEEFRLERELTAAGARSAPAAPLLELEQDLRHVREERAWLERRVSEPSAR